jgi:D-lyxose ketol-isomerase
MRRSFIDSRIDAMLEFCSRQKFALPPFSLWGPARFRDDPVAARRIADGGLGWSVVEFKPGGFAKDGLTLFTIRMGDWRELAKGQGRLYGEKAIMALEGQRTPHHYHIIKTEDILNRGGARFVVELFKVDRDGRRLDERFDVHKDASTINLGSGDRVMLEPGESIVLEPFIAHAFWAEGGPVLAGEVSLVNDDALDNYFLAPLASAEPINEDATARYVTVQDHWTLLATAR